MSETGELFNLPEGAKLLFGVEEELSPELEIFDRVSLTDRYEGALHIYEYHMGTGVSERKAIEIAIRETGSAISPEDQ